MAALLRATENIFFNLLLVVTVIVVEVVPVEEVVATMSPPTAWSVSILGVVKLVKDKE